MAADAAATYRQRHRVAFRLPGAIARVEPHPGRRPRTIRDEFGKIETPAPMARQPERGRRRTRQDQISPGAFGPGETAKLSRRSAPNEETPVSSAGPVLERASPFQNTIQPFDLMSRRHPLSSTRAAGLDLPREEADRPGGSIDAPASSRRHPLDRRELLLLLRDLAGLLRSLLHCALRLLRLCLLSLLSFLRHVALQC